MNKLLLGGLSSMLLAVGIAPAVVAQAPSVSDESTPEAIDDQYGEQTESPDPYGATEEIEEEDQGVHGSYMDSATEAPGASEEDGFEGEVGESDTTAPEAVDDFYGETDQPQDDPSPTQLN